MAALAKADPTNADDQATTLLRQLKLDGWSVVIDAIAAALRKAALAGAHEIDNAALEGDFDVVDQPAVDFAWDRAAELVGKRVQADGSIIDNPNAQWAITDSTRDTLRELVRVAIQDGWSTQQLKTHIRDSTAFGSQRALTIARTETARAHAFGAQAAAKAGGFAHYKEWLLGSEHSVDDECDDNSDDGPIPIDEEFSSGDPHPPAHPNAVLAGSTFASYGRLLEMVSARYAGPARRIIADGIKTTIGTNHPMLTSKGMVRAAELREGDYLVYDLRMNLTAAANQFAGGPHPTSTEPNFEQIPLVENCFETLRAIGVDTFVTRTSHDFHGDAQFCEDEIHVVRPQSPLLAIWDARGIEQFRERGFMRPGTDNLAFARSCTGLDAPDRIAVSAAGFVGGAGVYALLRVNHIETVEFVGHAFDATTESSLYCSDGFVVSNCSCTVIYTEEAEEKVEKQEAWTVGAEGEKPTTSSSPIDMTESTAGRAWTGDEVQLAHPLTPLELGREGERLALSYVRTHMDLGDPHSLNSEQEFEVDMIVDHQAFEVVSAQVNNPRREWQVGIEQPPAGPIETAWRKLLSPEKQAAHLVAKRQAVIERKRVALAELSRELGVEVVPKTFAIIINPDSGIADFQGFDGFHERIGWEQARVVASYKYGEF